jgi:hypothetical protein
MKEASSPEEAIGDIWQWIDWRCLALVALVFGLVGLLCFISNQEETRRREIVARPSHDRSFENANWVETGGSCSDPITSLERLELLGDRVLAAERRVAKSRSQPEKRFAEAKRDAAMASYRKCIEQRVEAEEDHDAPKENL